LFPGEFNRSEQIEPFFGFTPADACNGPQKLDTKMAFS
jgi:hypothetical protein